MFRQLQQNNQFGNIIRILPKEKNSSKYDPKQFLPAQLKTATSLLGNFVNGTHPPLVKTFYKFVLRSVTEN